MQMSAAAIWLNTVFASFDWNITAAIHKLYEIGGGFFTPFFDFISFLGHDGIPLILISIFLMLFSRTRKYGTAMLIGLAVGALITNCVLKVLIARARPYADQTGLYYSLWQMVGMATESDKSFPSGHTTAAFASMIPLWLLGNRKYSWTALIFAVLMGVARIYLVVHYPTDVIAGILVGIVGGIAGYLLAAKVIPSRFYHAKLCLPAKQGRHQKYQGKH